MKKALLFNPYLDTLGGGEFYFFSVAQFLQKQGFLIEIAWFEKNILTVITNRFGLKSDSSFKINKKAYEIFKKRGGFLEKLSFTRNYDLIFFVSDGSIPFLFSKKNILLFQSPFITSAARRIPRASMLRDEPPPELKRGQRSRVRRKPRPSVVGEDVINVGGSRKLNKLKLKLFHNILCYSDFVKKFIDKEFRINSTVLRPPINSLFFKLKPALKENIILSVGRFDQIMNAKKQAVLVKVFKKMVDKGLKNWQLVLLGGLKKKGDYFNNLKRSVGNYPIKIYANVSFKALINYYKRSRIYWHAAGFGEDLDLQPQKAEHFGISIVEAIICGLKPLVFKGGGIIEIIKQPEFLWTKEEELMFKTNWLIKSKKSKDLLIKQQQYCQNNFKKENFEHQLNKLIF